MMPEPLVGGIPDSNGVAHTTEIRQAVQADRNYRIGRSLSTDFTQPMEPSLFDTPI